MDGPPHCLEEHLQKVAVLAGELAKQRARLARLAGQWRDLANTKASNDTSAKTNGSEAHVEGKVVGREKTHSAAGAL